MVGAVEWSRTTDLLITNRLLDHPTQRIGTRYDRAKSQRWAVYLLLIVVEYRQSWVGRGAARAVIDVQPAHVACRTYVTCSNRGLFRGQPSSDRHTPIAES